VIIDHHPSNRRQRRPTSTLQQDRMLHRHRNPSPISIIFLGTVCKILIFRGISVHSLNMPPLGPTAGTNPGVLLDKDGNRPRTSGFGPKQNHPTSYDEHPSFRGPLVLERGATTSHARQRIRNYYLATTATTAADEGTKEGRPPLVLPDRARKPLSINSPTKLILKSIVDHLAYRDAPVDAKEVAESVEFYLRTSKRLLGSARRRHRHQPLQPNRCSDVTVIDLCSGHGLTGMLFAACNPPRDDRGGVRTVLVDRTEPPAHGPLRRCISELCPWVSSAPDERGLHDDGPPSDGGSNTVRFVEATLDAFRIDGSDCQSSTPRRPSIVISTHACGSLTDQVLSYAVRTRAEGVAVMPCCYTGTDRGVPYGVRRALGVAMAADVRRSFGLEEDGYSCDFATVPSEISPMNRVLIGEKR